MVQATIDNKLKQVTIVLPLCPEGTPSSSDKSDMIASTFGNQKIFVNGYPRPVTISVNLYNKRPKTPATPETTTA